MGRGLESHSGMAWPAGWAAPRPRPRSGRAAEGGLGGTRLKLMARPCPEPAHAPWPAAAETPPPGRSHRRRLGQRPGAGRMPAAPGPGPGGEGGLAQRGGRGPARAPGAAAWPVGGQTAAPGPRGASGLPWPLSPTPDAPDAATWPGGSGTTPGAARGPRPVGRGRPALPSLHPSPGLPGLRGSACWPA